MRLNDWLKQASVELVILQCAGGARGPLVELVNNVVASLAEFFERCAAGESGAAIAASGPRGRRFRRR